MRFTVFSTNTKKKLDDYFLYGKHEVLNMNGVKFFWNALSSDLESFMNNIDSEDKEKYLIENNIIDKYLLNKKLVDLTQIPEILINEFTVPTFRSFGTAGA